MKKAFVACVILLAIASSQGLYVSENNARLSPRLLNYQGYLTDTLGIPITNPSLSMTFAIFDAGSSGNQKWTESQPSVSVNKGIFHVILGEVTPIPDSVFVNSTDRWLELVVGGQVLSPRTRVTAAGYAYTSTFADTAQYAHNAAVDNDWVYLVSDGADTTLQAGGQWGLARAGNMLYGNADSTHVNFGISCTTGQMYLTRKYCTISGGFANSVFDDYSTIAGGRSNYTNWSYAAIGGGYDNSAIADYSTIAGGSQNRTNGSYAAVAGGRNNFAGDYGASVGGGEYDTASGGYATVSGGHINVASEDHATIGGGYRNTASSYYSTVGGGSRNYNAGYLSTIAGGYCDSIAAGADFSYLFGINSNLTQDSTFMVDMPHIWFGTEAAGYEFPDSRGTDGQIMITDANGQMNWSSIPADNDWTYRMTDTADTTLQMGGQWGLARSGNVLFGNADSTHVNLGVACTTGTSGQNQKYCTVSGGKSNTASGNMASVLGGQYNKARGQYSVAVGGGASEADSNSAQGTFSVISGGYHNITVGSASVISGGSRNTASGYHSSVGGGRDSDASGDYTTVGGGYLNAAIGDYSTISGGSCGFITGNYSSIGGGYHSYITGEYSTVSGGYYNRNFADYSVIPGGYADTIAAGADFSYLFGINSNLTQDSTFMVDMPHIWFGTEAAGYEFPDSRGTDGQIMITDASGQLSWGDQSEASKWTMTDSVLYTNGFWGLARGGSGNVLFGDSVYSHVNLGYYACTTGVSGQHHIGNVISGGNRNRTDSSYATIAGGALNHAIGLYSTISGGVGNYTRGTYSNIAGGRENNTGAGLAAVAGGSYNEANGLGSFIGGGGSNIAQGEFSAIFGGSYNTITATGDYSYLFGINSDLTQDSTFMVDMPHVWFGTEAAGYEFPRQRGADGQVMITDASGQLSWGEQFDASKWTVTDSVLYTKNLLGLARGGAGNVMYGAYPFRDVNFGSNACTTGMGTHAASYHFIGNGYGNRADSAYTTIINGYSNKAIGQLSFIGCGYQNSTPGQGAAVVSGRNNSASGLRSFIGGGYYDTLNADYGVIVGGYDNYAGFLHSDTSAMVVGGWSNQVRAKYSLVVGGRSNIVSGDYSASIGGFQNNVTSTYGFCGGGNSHEVHGDYAVIAGGVNNRSSGVRAFIGAGGGNQAYGFGTFIGSGENGVVNGHYGGICAGIQDSVNAEYGIVGSGSWNVCGDAADDTSAAILGGTANRVRAKYGSLVGGRGNSVDAMYSFVGGGYKNTVSGTYAAIVTGDSNTVTGDYSSIAGGYDNTISSDRGFIGAGAGNTISSEVHGFIGSGWQNLLSGYCSSILNGYQDTVTANSDYSMAFGRSVYVDTTFTAAFFDATYWGRIRLNADHHSIARTVTNPIYVGTSTANGNEANLTVAGVWTNGTFDDGELDRVPIDGADVLKKVAGLRISKASFTCNNEKHIIPDTKEFHDAFDCGGGNEDLDARSISSLDIAGVSLAAVQELVKIVESQQKEIEELHAEITVLKQK